MVLDKTVDMMLSEEYTERFRAEYHQLVYRTNKLRTMLNKLRKNELDFKPKCSEDLLLWQLKAMEQYLYVLKRRAEVEGIKF